MSDEKLIILSLALIKSLQANNIFEYLVCSLFTAFYQHIYPRRNTSSIDVDSCGKNTILSPSSGVPLDNKHDVFKFTFNFISFSHKLHHAIECFTKL